MSEMPSPVRVGAYTKVTRDHDYVWVPADPRSAGEDAAALGRLVGSWHQETGSGLTVGVAQTGESALVVLAGTLTGIGADGRKTTRAEVYRVPQPATPEDWLGLAAEAHEALSRWRGLGEIPFFLAGTPRPMPSSDRNLGLNAVVDHLEGQSPWIQAESPAAAIGVYEELYPYGPDLILVADSVPRDADRWTTPLLLARRRPGGRPMADMTAWRSEDLPALWALRGTPERRRALWQFASRQSSDSKLELSLAEVKWLVRRGLDILHLWPLAVDTAASLFEEGLWGAREAQWLLESATPDGALAESVANALRGQDSHIPAFIHVFGRGASAVTKLLPSTARTLFEAILAQGPVVGCNDHDANLLSQAGLIDSLGQASLEHAVAQTGHNVFWQAAAQRAANPSHAHLIRALALSEEPLVIAQIQGLADLSTSLLHALPAAPLKAAVPSLSGAADSADALIALLAGRPDFGEGWMLEVTQGVGADALVWLRGQISRGKVTRHDALARLLRAAETADGAQLWAPLLADLGLPADGIFGTWIAGSPPPIVARPDESSLWESLRVEGQIDVAAIILRATPSSNHRRWLLHAGLPTAEVALLVPGLAGVPRLPLAGWDSRLTGLLAESVTGGHFWSAPGLVADLPALRWLSKILSATTVGGELAVAALHLEHGTPLDDSYLATLLPALEEPERVRQTALRWEQFQRDPERSFRLIPALVRHPELRRWLLSRLDPLSPPSPEPSTSLSTGVVIALSSLLSAAELLRFAIAASGSSADWDAIARDLCRKSTRDGLLIANDTLMLRIGQARPELAAALRRMPGSTASCP